MQRLCGWLSGLCALHCLSLPLLLALLPELRLALHQFGTPAHRFMQGLVWSQHYEAWILGGVLVLHALALLRRPHRRAWISALAGGGCLIGAQALYDWRARALLLLMGVLLLRRALQCRAPNAQRDSPPPSAIAADSDGSPVSISRPG